MCVCVCVPRSPKKKVGSLLLHLLLVVLSNTTCVLIRDSINDTMTASEVPGIVGPIVVLEYTFIYGELSRAAARILSYLF